MINFSKNGNCPTSPELLAFQKGDVDGDEGSTIRKHLADCEFCSAEVAFYGRYPQSGDISEAPVLSEMPKPLYELAEALMIKRRDDTFFDELMNPDEDVITTYG